MSTPLPSFDPSHKAASLQGGFRSPARRTRRTRLLAATQRISRSMAPWSVSQADRALDLPEFSPIARTERTRAPVVAFLTALPSHPPRAWRGQALGGAGFHNRSLTYTNLRHFPCLPPVPGGTPFLSSLLHQFFTSPQARMLHRQAMRRPLVSCAASATLGAATVQSLSGGLVRFRNPQACRSRHRFSPLELPLPVCSHTRTRYERQRAVSEMPVHFFPRGQHALVAQSRRAGGACGWNGVVRRGLQSLFPKASSLSTHDAYEYEHRRSVACRTSTIGCMRLPRSFIG